MGDGCRKRSRGPSVAVASAIVGALLFGAPTRAEDLHFVTTNYPPLNFRAGDDIKGSSVDMIRLVMAATGMSYTIEIMPWARAMALATMEPGYCIFTTVHTQERDQKFKWVEPMLRSRTVLIRKAGASVAPRTLEEAKAFRVGTMRGDSNEAMLRANQFPKIDLASDLELTLKKLMSNRIDLMPVSEQYVERARLDGVPVEPVLTLAENTYSIACNKMTPDAAVRQMQATLDRLIADGTQARIFRHYGLSGVSNAAR